MPSGNRTTIGGKFAPGGCQNRNQGRFEQPTLCRRGPLLQLSGSGVATQASLRFLDFLRTEPHRPEQLAVSGARIDEPDRGDPARARWGDVFALTGDQNAKMRFDNDRSGYRLSNSVGGSITGEGGDRIVCDDPHKVDEVHSDAVRKAALDRWDVVMSTRVNDPKTSAKVVVMQRCHQQDLSGHLLEQGGWEHLSLPAEYEGPGVRVRERSFPQSYLK